MEWQIREEESKLKVLSDPERTRVEERSSSDSHRRDERREKVGLSNEERRNV